MADESTVGLGDALQMATRNGTSLRVLIFRSMSQVQQERCKSWQ